MRSVKLLSTLLLGGCLLLLSSPASADEIDFGTNSGLGGTGSIGISCTPGGPCTLSLNAPVGTVQGDANTLGSANFVASGSPSIPGWYQFAGGPSSITNLETSNGGLTFTASGSWTFSFEDNAGDMITNATATWTSFFNVSSIGFNVGQLTLSGGTCTGVIQGFCSDFGSGGIIDVTLENMPTDLATLYKNGGSASNVMIEGGSITSSVPEPGTLALFGTGLIGMAGFVRRKLGKF